jgi:voltage-gated potassium channel
MIVAMVAMFSEVLRACSASSDLVMGAVCLYLVIGLAWTFLYYSICLLSPGSIFVSPKTSILTASDTEAKFTEVLYFSFAALTTIGSSGEQALTPMVRQPAVVESAMGQLYLAVLISRLVGFSTRGDAKSI